jgi:hypothetical protein
MKKLAIGCLIAAALFGIAGLVATYVVYRAVKTTFIDPATTAMADLAAFKTVPDLERQVRNTNAFAPPESGRLTPAQVERLVAVQTHVRQTMGAQFAQLERRYKTLLEKKEASALDLPELISAYRDLAKIWLAGKTAQVEGLNRVGLSLAEYRWIRSQSYSAVGVPLMSMDVAEMIDQAMRGETPVEPPARFEGAVGPSGPAENQPLIEPFKKQLEENAALAIFGL